jgi:hypothetical protein
MDIGSFFLILALLIVVALFVARPLFENKSQMVTQEEHEVSALLAERDRVITALQELDFDYQMGKIPEEDYPAQRASLMQAGSETLRRLDTLQQTGAADSAEERLEKVIAARRADAARARQPMPAGGTPASATAGGSNGDQPADDTLESLIASRRRQREEKAAGFCPQCGSPLHRSDKFCPRCGGKL